MSTGMQGSFKEEKRVVEGGLSLLRGAFLSLGMKRTPAEGRVGQSAAIRVLVLAALC